jgi:Alginate lyase
MRRRLTLGCLLLCLSSCNVSPAAPRLDREHTSLRTLVASDPEAALCFKDLKDAADTALHDQPYPIKTIVSEGHLQSDPNRIRTYESLPDMDKIDALHWAFIVTGDPRYLAKLHAFLLSWATTNVSEGNPINDTKLDAAFSAYGDTRPTFTNDERTTIDHWLRATAHALIDKLAKSSDHAKTNWQSHRLKMIGFVAFILGDADLKKYTRTRYKQQIADNLLPNGSSIDFEERDALHYQLYDLEPLLTLAIVADQSNVNLYSYTAPTGSSLPKSVAFLLPFCAGTEKHAEFVHSKVDFDRQRAASGDNSYKAGRLFNPRDGIGCLELAAYFSPDIVPLIARLCDSDAKRFPTWQTVLNAAEHTK